MTGGRNTTDLCLLVARELLRECELLVRRGFGVGAWR